MAKNRKALHPTQAAERAQAAAIAKVLAAAGLSFEFARGKHLQVVCRGERIGISGSPRDIKNAVNAVRQSAQRLVERYSIEDQSE